MSFACRPGVFTLDGVDGACEGLTSGATWNGWATPLFERAAAARIAGALGGTYDGEADAFLFDDGVNEPLVCPATVVRVDGDDVIAYPVGTRAWTWQESDPPAATPLPSPRPITPRLVFEAGTDPLTGEDLPREEETVTVEAPTPEHAARRAMLHARTNPRGRLVCYATADGTPVYAA